MSIIQRLFERFARRRRNLCATAQMTGIGTGVLDYHARKQLYQTLHYVRAVHTLLAGAANRLRWYAEVEGVELPEISRILNAQAGLLFADWLVLGEAWVTHAWVRTLSQADLWVRIPHPAPPLEAAASLMVKLRELERAQVQAYWRHGATTFIMPLREHASLAVTPSELEATREAILRSTKEAGVGGIDLLPAPVEFVELRQKLADYRFETLTTQLVRELCNLFGLDSSLLNDPENKTYSNKTEAQKALFVNVIIPQSELFAEYFNIALSARQVDLRLRFDSSRIESLAEERERQHKWLLELYKAQAISLEELREGLGYSKR